MLRVCALIALVVALPLVAQDKAERTKRARQALEVATKKVADLTAELATCYPSPDTPKFSYNEMKLGRKFVFSGGGLVTYRILGPETLVLSQYVLNRYARSDNSVGTEILRGAPFAIKGVSTKGLITGKHFEDPPGVWEVTGTMPLGLTTIFVLEQAKPAPPRPGRPADLKQRIVMINGELAAAKEEAGAARTELEKIDPTNVVPALGAALKLGERFHFGDQVLQVQQVFGKDMMACRVAGHSLMIKGASTEKVPATREMPAPPGVWVATKKVRLQLGTFLQVEPAKAGK